MCVYNGKIEDVFYFLPLIKKEIPEKRYLRKEDIKERLEGREMSIKILVRGDEYLGIAVWYAEKEKEIAYLWLGVCKEKGKGYGSILLASILEELKEKGYKEVHTKCNENNIIAQRHLMKFGFTPYRIKDGVIYLKKVLCYDYS